LWFKKIRNNTASSSDYFFIFSVSCLRLHSLNILYSLYYHKLTLYILSRLTAVSIIFWKMHS
jgi:hypothetical protein